MSVKTLNDLMDIAIQEEIRSQKLYLDAKAKTTDKQICDFFSSLAKQEKTHEKVLKSVKEMEIFDGSITIDAEVLKRTELSHSITDESLIQDQTLDEIFQIALKREKKAYTLYDEMAESSRNEEVKLLFNNLANEERIHHKNIEKTYMAQSGQMGYEG